MKIYSKYFEEGVEVNLLFKHCPKCAYFDRCYERGSAAFLDPTCGDGPVKEEDK